MAEQFASLSATHVAFIQAQQLFFVGTAGTDGYVNVAPKGMDTLRVVDSGRIAWLNLTGSGNETAAHLLDVNRMTLMFCSFERQPLIMRVYGRARTVHPRDDDWPQLLALFPPIPGARQVFVLDVELVLTSCGYGVPYYEFRGERQTMVKWTEKRGVDGIQSYWRERNARSINGRDTGIVRPSGQPPQIDGLEGRD